ncbi:hypothetical protein QR46_4922 [Giardia duodenalis assemblage B]|uniref:Variant-specific surface protein n=1 Tax=Giardia duodenalis assemblage B TaxID=1394984 RepID=A0A132NM27_GIAIN|nr:hypothetical protein QR46_4922 [Giardia intestinalis assemblage B]
MPLRMRGRISRLVRQIVAVSSLQHTHQATRVHTLLAGRYCSVGVAGSSACREARDGACAMYREMGVDEEHSVDDGRRGAHDSTERDERVREATCTQGSNNCQTCGATIGANTYCSVCNGENYAPVDGVCVDASTPPGNTFCIKGSSGTCSTCKGVSFMYQGGCYQTSASNPGKTLCTAASDGKCTQAAAGYFIPPGATADKQSVVKCDDTTGVEVSSNTYKGVDKCATCTAPSSVTVREAKAAICESCIEGYYVDSDGSVCTQCTDTNNCAVCLATGANKGKCTECKSNSSNNYLKITDTETQSGDCVAQAACTGTHFPVVADKKCYPCSNTDKGGIANCQACTMSGSAVTCDTCTGTNKPNTAGTACVACSITDCASCDKEDVCATCDSGKYLTPTAQCVDSCDKLGGYYSDGQRVCQPCDPSCASCTAAGADKCLSCPAGKALKYTSESSPTDGTCVDECKTGAGGCADCGATIGGSKYCSRCSDTNQAPLNGNCAANTARTKFCTNASNGACTQCANNYFLLDGGCYETSRQPGKSVCTTESGGKCQTCANSLNPDGDGVCPACPAGCSKCSGNSGSETCSECLAGYYLSTNKCVKCTENSNGITGVPNCVSCKEPSGASGTVTCYVTQTPTVNPTDPSVNKGGLSSGAIAGISIAVIAVVGGLVGFLCWWFIYRGKA